MVSDVQWRTREHARWGAKWASIFGEWWFGASSQRKSAWRQTLHNFWSVPTLSSDFKDSTLWHCHYSSGISESVCTMGAHDAHRGAQKTACCMCFDIYDALSQGRRRHFETYCDRRWDMGVPYHTWIKTAVLALEAYWLAEKEKVQADDFNKEDHVHRILIQTRCSLGRIFAPGTTINSAVYFETLKKLRLAIQNKRRGMLSATILFLHDNARQHSAAQTQDLITSFRWEQMDHPFAQPWFGAKWFSPLPTPKEVPGRQAMWRRRWPERCSAEVANIAGGPILWGGYTKTCAPLW